MPMKTETSRSRSEERCSRQIEVEVANRQDPTTSLPRRSDHGADLLPLEEGIRRAELSQAKRLKELEKENVKLKRSVAELSLEKQILKDVAEENFVSRAAPGRSGTGAQKVPGERTICLSGAWAVGARDATLSADGSHRRRRR